MKHVHVLITFAVLVACSAGASESDIEQTVTARLTAEAPTLTLEPTKIPLFDLDLGPLLLQPGDLPSEFEAQQIKDTPPRGFDDLPTPAQLVSVGFRNGAYASDGVTIWLYEDQGDLDAAYEAVSGTLDNARDMEIGERAVMAQREVTGVISRRLVFTRCAALVYVDIFSPLREDIASTYARRVDGRLEDLLLCG